MRDYAFNVDVAAKYGVDEAILIHAMEFWIKKNRSNERHFHDGRWWSYNSLAALGDLFPFWTKRQLERIISSCRDKGILYVGNYNEEKWKRTTWYALDDCIFEIYGDDLCISRNGEMQITNQGSVPTKKGKCISRNGEMHITKPGNACPETGKSISPGGEMDTILNPVYIPTVTPLTPQGAGAGFDAFWKAYPRKAGKKDALKAWKKLKPDSALLGMILSALDSQKRSPQWTKDGGQFIPYPATWINGEHWTDELPQSPNPSPVGRSRKASEMEVLPEWT